MARFAARLRDITAAVDPDLQLHRLQSAAESFELNRFMRMFPVAIFAVTLSVVLLSAAGIYAMLSFTIARRRREIGIRSASAPIPAASSARSSLGRVPNSERAWQSA